MSEEGEVREKRARAPAAPHTKIVDDHFVDPFCGAQFHKGVIGRVTRAREEVFVNLPVYRRYLETMVEDDSKRMKWLREACERYDQALDAVPSCFSRDKLKGYGGDQELSQWMEPFNMWNTHSEMCGVSVEQWLKVHPPKKAPKKKRKQKETLVLHKSLALLEGNRLTVAVTCDPRPEDAKGPTPVQLWSRVVKYGEKNSKELRMKQHAYGEVFYFEGEDEGTWGSKLAQTPVDGPVFAFMRKKATFTK
jgi:hypothetical protein